MATEHLVIPSGLRTLMAQKVGVLLSRNSGDYLLACGLHCAVSLCRLTKPIERFQEEATFMCMKRRSVLRTSAAFIGASLLAARDSQADHIHPQHVHAASLMTECAKRFLAALDAHQRGKVTFPFDRSTGGITRPNRGKNLSHHAGRASCLYNGAVFEVKKEMSYDTSIQVGALVQS